MTPTCSRSCLDPLRHVQLDTKVAEMSGVSADRPMANGGWSEEGKEDCRKWNGAGHQGVPICTSSTRSTCTSRTFNSASRATPPRLLRSDEVQGGIYHYIDDEYACGLTEKQFQIDWHMTTRYANARRPPRVGDKKLRIFNPRSQIWERQRVQRYVQRRSTLSPSVGCIRAGVVRRQAQHRLEHAAGRSGSAVTVMASAVAATVHVL